MPNEPYRGRVFTAAEVRRILSRAATLEDTAAPDGRPAGRPHVREEIERIATDAGIGAGALQRALEEEGEGARPEPRSRPLSVAGAPTHVALERTVRGALAASSHPDLARALRNTVGAGEATHSEDAAVAKWVWTSSPLGGRRARARVESSADGRITVSVEESLQPARAGTFTLAWVIGLAILVPLISALPHEVAHALVPYLLLAWAVVPYLAARAIYARRFRAREAELTAAVAELAAIVGSTAPSAAAPRLRVMGAADAKDGDDASPEAIEEEPAVFRPIRR